ncbi:MAG TPA: TadE/TadG family type IV pilus assembly protein [Sphingomicrobium sp.]|nr:TadE/TadG family type IV pilus assembly protein [Sphingomicrobium sp.]
MTLPSALTLRRDERGAAVIEMAMVAPVLALIVIGVVDMSNAFSRKLALEQGAQRAIEKIMQTTEQDTVETTLATEAVCQVNGTNSDGTCKTSPISASNVTVTWRLDCTASGGAITSYSATTSATFDTYSCPTGTARQAEYIQVALTDTYTPLFPIHFASFNGDGTYHLSATAGVRTS